MDTLIYEYKTQGRTLFSLGFLVAAIAFVLLGANFGAPIYWYMPPGFALLFCAWWFMSNPSHGCKLTEKEFAFWSNKEGKQIQLSDIGVVERKTWMDGPDDFSFIQKNGEKHSLSHLHFGNSEEFSGALAKVGVPVTKKN